MKRFAPILIAMAVIGSVGAALAKDADKPRIKMTTSMGVIELELYPDKAPKTVANFLEYARAGHYDGTLFHRIKPDFVIQGGGFEPGMKQKPVRAPIENEADNGLKNFAGTIAMARTPVPHSATSQFFINTLDNSTAEWRKRLMARGIAVSEDAVYLDHKEKTQEGWGYAVFGKVTKGMDVVKKIEAVATRTVGPFENVPVKDVVIKKIEILGNKAGVKSSDKSK